MPKIHYDNAVVFAIKCILNDDVFITSSTGELNRAFGRIKNKMKNNNHHVYQNMLKNGIENYYTEILEKLENCKCKSDIKRVESKFIKLLKPNQNIPVSSDSSNSVNDDEIIILKLHEQDNNDDNMTC